MDKGKGTWTWTALLISHLRGLLFVPGIEVAKGWRAGSWCWELKEMEVFTLELDFSCPRKALQASIELSTQIYDKASLSGPCKGFWTNQLFGFHLNWSVLQFISDANQPGLPSDSTRLRAWSPTRLPLLQISAVCEVPKPPIILTDWLQIWQFQKPPQGP